MRTWEESRKYCAALGGKLLEITDMSDYAKILDYIKLSKFIINYIKLSKLIIDYIKQTELTIGYLKLNQFIYNFYNIKKRMFIFKLKSFSCNK